LSLVMICEDFLSRINKPNKKGEGEGD